MSIYTGFIGDETINCCRSREEGDKGMKSIIGNKFGCVKLKKKKYYLLEQSNYQ